MFSSIFYENVPCTTGCLHKDMPDKCILTAVNPFLGMFLVLFFQVGECKIAPPVTAFDRDLLQQQRVANI